MAEFAINVLELESGAKRLDFVVRRAWLTEAIAGGPPGAPPMRADEDGALECHAELSGATDVLVRCSLRATVVTECVRCLSDAAVVVDGEIAMLLAKRKEGARVGPPEDVDVAPDDIDRDTYAGDTVVLDDAVREHVLVEVPMQPLCREDCAGIPIPDRVRGPADLRLSPIVSAFESLRSRDPRGDQPVTPKQKKKQSSDR